MDCSLPGSCVHGILQARIPEWVAIAFSKGSSGPRDRTWVSCIEGRFLTFWGTREAQEQIRLNQKKAHQSEYSAYQASITWGLKAPACWKGQACSWCVSMWLRWNWGDVETSVKVCRSHCVWTCDSSISYCPETLFPVSSPWLESPWGLPEVFPACMSRWTSLVKTRAPVTQTKPLLTVPAPQDLFQVGKSRRKQQGAKCVIKVWFQVVTNVWSRETSRSWAGQADLNVSPEMNCLSSQLPHLRVLLSETERPGFDIWASGAGRGSVNDAGTWAIIESACSPCRPLNYIKARLCPSGSLDWLSLMHCGQWLPRHSLFSSLLFCFLWQIPFDVFVFYMPQIFWFLFVFFKE